MVKVFENSKALTINYTRANNVSSKPPTTKPINIPTKNIIAKYIPTGTKLGLVFSIISSSIFPCCFNLMTFADILLNKLNFQKNHKLKMELNKKSKMLK